MGMPRANARVRRVFVIVKSLRPLRFQLSLSKLSAACHWIRVVASARESDASLARSRAHE
jgi:hypothetical protein